MVQIYVKMFKIKNKRLKIFINMIKMTSLIKEGNLEIPSTNLLRWFLKRKDSTFVMFDTETTGLSKGRTDQITQLAAIAAKFDLRQLKFVEVGRFHEKIKLNDYIKDIVDKSEDVPDDKDSPEFTSQLQGNNVKAVLKFNHYDLVNSDEFADERESLERFDSFLDKHSNVVLMAHNAPFDLSMIQVHEIFKTKDREVFDTISFFNKVFFPALESLSTENEHFRSINDKFASSARTGKKSSAMGSLISGFFSDPAEKAALLGKSHDALVDCENTLNVIERGLKIISSHIR
jgi:DNA polymerase III alpha subunit (gram-positive type)